MRYIITLYPGIDLNGLVEWLQKTEWDNAYRMAQIVMNGHNQYDELPPMSATTKMSLIFGTNFAVIREAERHTGMLARQVRGLSPYGRKVDRYAIAQELAQGFTIPYYMDKVKSPTMLAIREKYIKDMADYYDQVVEFTKFVEEVLAENGIEDIDYSFVYNLLPMNHHSKLFMEANPKQMSYFRSIREAAGAHIDFQYLIFLARRSLLGILNKRKAQKQRRDPIMAVIAGEPDEDFDPPIEDFYKRS